METSYLDELDEYFCANYSDYTRLSATEGYEMPEMLTVGANGTIERKDEALMRLINQPNRMQVLCNFKRDYRDTNFTFNFCYPAFGERFKDRFRKYTFAKVLPSILAHSGETAQSAGEKLALEPKIWNAIVKGNVYPEKCTVLALALVCRLSMTDVNGLLAVCGFTLQNDSVRDVVVEYLLQQKIFNRMMRNRALEEYNLVSLPIREDA